MTCTLPPPLDLHSLREQTFLGFRFTQSWADLQIWEYVLNQHDNLTTIIEIGTWEGGMSRFLQTQATYRNMGFTTMDVNPPEIPVPGFVPIDVFEEADEVRTWLGMHTPLILLCDGGDKPREMREFALALAPGDLLAVHDWLGEVWPKDVPDCLEPLYEPFCEAIKSHTRFFTRKDDA